MATSFRLEIKKRPSSQGTFPIFIRITQNRKLKRIKTSVELNRLSDWNGKTKNGKYVRSSERNAEIWNDALAIELEEAKKAFREDKTASADSIVSKIKKKDVSTSFIKYAESYTAKLIESGTSNARAYGTFCNKIRAFANSKGWNDIAFNDITPSLISEFEGFLRIQKNERTKSGQLLSPNAVRTHLVKFRALVNKAIFTDNLMAEGKYPFNKKYRMPKEIKTPREALDESEIEAICSLEYPEGSTIWNVRNAFLFSYYCAGIRIGDLLMLRWKNIEGDRLSYSMDKNDKARNYKLMPQAQKILEHYRSEGSKPTDYIFPFLNSTASWAIFLNPNIMPLDQKKCLFNQIYSKSAMINKKLKRIAEDAGISKNVSFHVSRHTFASIAREKGTPSKIVQEALAHSELATTEGYMHSFGSEEVDNALQKVFTPTSAKANNEEQVIRYLKGLDKEALADLLGKLQTENE